MVSGYKCLKPRAHTVSCTFPWTVLLGASCSNFPFWEGSVDTFQGFLLFSFQHPRRHGWWPISLHFLKTLLAYSSQGIWRWGDWKQQWYGRRTRSMVATHSTKPTSWFLNVPGLCFSPESWPLPASLGSLSIAVATTSLHPWASFGIAHSDLSCFSHYQARHQVPSV